MATSASCCLNCIPPRGDPNYRSCPSHSKSAVHVLRKDEEHGSGIWTKRSKIGMGVACIVIMGVERGNMVINSDKAVAVEKWSEKRECPAWNKSRESVVPENLPRPSARRHWESVSFISKTAPPLKVITTAKPNCFSL